VSAPRWLSDGLAAIMLAIAAYCAIRPAAARRWHRSTERDVDAAHVLMGVAMAAALVPGLDPLRTGVWAAAFAAASAWFAARALRDWRERRARPTRTARSRRSKPGRDAGTGHHLVHLLSCGSMLYMLVAASAAGASAAGMTSGLAGPVSRAGPAAIGAAISPVITLVLAVAMAGSVVLTTDRLAVLAPARAADSAGRSAAGRATAGPAAAGLAAAVEPAGATEPAQRRDRAVLCPRLAASCQIAIGITMVYLLVQML